MNSPSPPPAPPSWPKRCSCGRTFTRQEWEGLPLLGLQPPGESPQGQGHLWYGQELRNCPCGSTLAVEVEPYKPTHGP